MARKGGRGRPPLDDTVVIRLTLRLHPGEDDDLIAFFEQFPPEARMRARAVIAAMRSGSLGDAAEQVHDLDEDAALAGLASLFI